MDANLLNYLKDLQHEMENNQEMGNQDPKLDVAKKRGFKSNDFYVREEILKAQTADSKKDSARNAKTQCPTEKNQRKKVTIFFFGKIFIYFKKEGSFSK